MTKTVVVTIPLTCDGEWPSDDTIMNAVMEKIPGMFLSEDFDGSDKWAMMADDGFTAEIKKEEACLKEFAEKYAAMTMEGENHKPSADGRKCRCDWCVLIEEAKAALGSQE